MNVGRTATDLKDRSTVFEKEYVIIYLLFSYLFIHYHELTCEDCHGGHFTPFETDAEGTS